MTGTLTTEQVNSLANSKSNKSVKVILQELLEETTDNGVTNKELLAQKILALALNGHEGMIKLVWNNTNGGTSGSSLSLEWTDIKLDW